MTWAKHGLFDLELKAAGDLYIDEHHTVEDVGICLGQALNHALGERRGLVRTSHSYVPLDESLALVVVDLSGRPYCVVEAAFSTPKVGQLSTDLVAHLLESIAIHGKFNLHVKVISGGNDHHKIEAIFKALGRALDAASSLDDRLLGIVPSTKGVL
jgi:imidazoleglycerol-phosphate dehydratase